jgi:hypothetical protein
MWSKVFGLDESHGDGSPRTLEVRTLFGYRGGDLMKPKREFTIEKVRGVFVPNTFIDSDSGLWMHRVFMSLDSGTEVRMYVVALFPTYEMAQRFVVAESEYQGVCYNDTTGEGEE